MADQKTKSYEVRLIKGFSHELGHVRAGYRFMPGPTPQTVELTDEQVKQIEADPSLEFVSRSESRRVAALTQNDDSAPDPSRNGRRYADTPAGEQPENDTDKEPELSGLTRKELNELALTLGIEAPDKLKNVQEVTDAIEQARANINPEGTLDATGAHPDETFDFDGSEFKQETVDGEAQYTRDGEPIDQAEFEAAQELAKSDDSNQS